jgi:hypothetical protein
VSSPSLRLLVGVLLAQAAACHHRAPGAVTPVEARGTLVTTGASFDQHIVLRRRSGDLRLTGSVDDSLALSRIGGLDVSVRGADDGGVFRVSEFTVVAANGQPTLDGIVGVESGRVFLQTSGGRVTLTNPPPALLAMGGSRVWIAGPPATGPYSYGVIRNAATAR